MMRAIGMALLIVMAVNLLLVGAGIAWLGVTDRLSPERIDAAVALFSPTLDEERAAEEAAALEAEAEAERERAAARLAAVAESPTTLQQRLAEQDMMQQVNQQLVDRLKAESRAIQQRLEMSKSTITQLKRELEEERAAMEQFVEKHETQRLDEDFQQAVTFYEALKPKQAKASFLQLVREGRTQSVLDYLSAMQPRKAGAVLREFREPEEIAIATELLKELKNRGLGQGLEDDVQRAAAGGAS